MQLAASLADNVAIVEAVHQWEPGGAFVYGIFDGTDAVLVLFPNAVEHEVNVIATGRNKPLSSGQGFGVEDEEEHEDEDAAN